MISVHIWVKQLMFVDCCQTNIRLAADEKAWHSYFLFTFTFRLGHLLSLHRSNHPSKCNQFWIFVSVSSQLSLAQPYVEQALYKRLTTHSSMGTILYCWCCISNLGLSERNLIRPAEHNFCTTHCTTDLNLARCSPQRKCFEPRDWSSLQLSTNEKPRFKFSSCDQLIESAGPSSTRLKSSAVELRGALHLPKGFCQRGE